MGRAENLRFYETEGEDTGNRPDEGDPQDQIEIIKSGVVCYKRGRCSRDASNRGGIGSRGGWGGGEVAEGGRVVRWFCPTTAGVTFTMPGSRLRSTRMTWRVLVFLQFVQLLGSHHPTDL